MKQVLLHIFLLITISSQAQLVSTQPSAGNTYSLHNASILIDPNDHAVVLKSATLLQQDLFLLTGRKPAIIHQAKSGTVIIIGSADKSKIIKQVKKLQLSSIHKRWEAFHITSLTNPLPNTTEALVITGSDARGTAFGVFEFSNPWPA